MNLHLTRMLKGFRFGGLAVQGGASGLSRAFEYCLAYPTSKVIVLSVELCSLTFQRNDISKSNLIGTSLFSDGVSCVLVCGDEVPSEQFSKKSKTFAIFGFAIDAYAGFIGCNGWDVKDQGLYVIFSKDIPTIIKDWLKPNVQEFLMENGFDLNDVKDFIAHPGGKKVITKPSGSMKA
ncbi:hypothetical protein RCO48_25160 [Peribacillus frigoritolerans]|nr:hypothetical protein [Peribacillus frigoritolerans]